MDAGHLLKAVVGEEDCGLDNEVIINNLKAVGQDFLNESS